MPHHTTPHHTKPHHTTPHHTTPHHITSHHITSHHTYPRHLTSPHVPHRLWWYTSCARIGHELTKMNTHIPSAGKGGDAGVAGGGGVLVLSGGVTGGGVGGGESSFSSGSTMGSVARASRSGLRRVGCAVLKKSKKKGRKRKKRRRKKRGRKKQKRRLVHGDLDPSLLPRLSLPLTRHVVVFIYFPYLKITRRCIRKREKKFIRVIRAALTILLLLVIDRVMGALSLKGLFSPDPFPPFSCRIYGCTPVCYLNQSKLLQATPTQQIQQTQTNNVQHTYH